MFRRLRPLLGPRIRVLEIAPTRAFGNACRAAGDIDYVSVDKASPLAMARMDVQRLGLREQTFDVVVCYHVLDYVADDRAAVREIHRVLKAGGIGFLQERVVRGQPTVEWGGPRPDALDRIREFGDDFPERLAQGGLIVVDADPVTFLVFREGGPLVNEAVAAIASRDPS
jgi:SAM-dependent methyltransferase